MERAADDGAAGPAAAATSSTADYEEVPWADNFPSQAESIDIGDLEADEDVSSDMDLLPAAGQQRRLAGRQLDNECSLACPSGTTPLSSDSTVEDGQAVTYCCPRQQKSTTTITKTKTISVTSLRKIYSTSTVTVNNINALNASSSARAPPAKPSRPRAGFRHHPLPRYLLNPHWGSGCPKYGRCGCGTAKDVGSEFGCQMTAFASYDLPISAYLFDGSSWSTGNSFSLQTPPKCTGTQCCAWNAGWNPLIRMRNRGVRSFVHFWGGCHNVTQYAALQRYMGDRLAGFYLDEASSDTEATQVANWVAAQPNEMEVIMKAWQFSAIRTTRTVLSTVANIAYMGDCNVDFAGLARCVARLFSVATLMPAPYSEFTGYDLSNRALNDETYYRRLHFGAFQVIMSHTPFNNFDPWVRSPALMNQYRKMFWAHKELVPFFHSYTMAMHYLPGQPSVFRNPGLYGPTSVMLGNEFYVQYITSSVRFIDVQLPPGQWVDFWDPKSVVSGLLSQWPVPLGKEPTFVRFNALIPLEVERGYAGHGSFQSKGWLTVLVYPGVRTQGYTFSYWNPSWAAFVNIVATTVDINTVTLSCNTGQPVMYRLMRQGVPSQVIVGAGFVTVSWTPGAAAATPVAGVWSYEYATQTLVVRQRW